MKDTLRADPLELLSSEALVIELEPWARWKQTSSLSTSHLIRTIVKWATNQEICWFNFWSPSLPHTTHDPDGTRQVQIQQREVCQPLQSQCTPEQWRVEKVIVKLEDTPLRVKMENSSKIHFSKQLPEQCLTSPPHWHCHSSHQIWHTQGTPFGKKIFNNNVVNIARQMLQYIK